MSQSYKQLDETQLKSFDTVYLTPENWEMIARHIAEAFPDGDFSFLDVGGGNGVFADQILERFPKARGTLLDNSYTLLDRNKPNVRKRLVYGSAMDLEKTFKDQTFDLIFFNWILHHLVADSYGKSVDNIRACLMAAQGITSARGYISVYENMYNGWLISNVPGRLVFFLTSNERLAPLVRKFGANTAGVGVCFLSKNAWGKLLAAAGLKPLHSTDDKPWETKFLYRLFLGIRDRHIRNYWCKVT